MKIAFHGAAGTVTGSKHLVSLDDGTNILLDCGMYQGLGARTQPLNDDLGFNASTISVVFLSHAHIDHSGLLPKLVAEGFTGKIYCTEATRDLSAVLLYDSAHIQANTRNDRYHQPSYTAADVEDTLALMECIDFDQWIEALPGVSVLYTRTGHLAGAAAIHLRLHEKNKLTTLTYSADVGRGRHPLWQPASAFPQAEYILLESTYGDKHHELQTSNVDALLQHIQFTCLEKKGKLIIPAFSVGRTQELLYILHQLEQERRLPQLSYFVDSPLGIKATELIKKHSSEFNEHLQQLLIDGQDPFSFTGLKYVEAVEDSIRLSQFDEPCVIISSSGTADAGRVRFHIGPALADQRNTILFSGYCGPESFGGELMAGAPEVFIGDDPHPVHAEIAQLKGLSAHGDSDDLCQFMSCQDPGLVRSVYLVHGERKAREKLASRLSAKGFFPVQQPGLHEEAELNLAVKSESIAI